MRKLFLVFCIGFICVSLDAQIIPDSLRVDWSHTGCEEILNPQTVLNVTAFGAFPNDDIDDVASISNAINALNGHAGILYFPPGIFDFTSTLYLADSVILKGAGADSTTLRFDLGNNGGDAIRIWKGQTASFIPVLTGYQKGSSKLVLADASSFTAGSFAELKETNGSWNSVPVLWATDCVGQILKILSLHGDTLFFDEPLRIDYSASLLPQIRVYNPITNAGIECLKVLRADSVAPVVSYNISFLGAANCWIKGVESDHSIGAHVLADISTHLSITGCYFHHAYEYDGVNTHGYGVTLIQHTGDCLIENNFFRHLRHSMMVKQGANGNVFTYNYSIEPTRTEFPTNGSGDISIHGHYPFANLFEGNIVQTIYIDQTYGPGGPYNTFFRNREDLYGIIISQGSGITDRNNFVGNEITNNNFLMGLYLVSGNQFLWGNNRQGNIDPAGSDSLSDLSYYYSSTPAFWNGINSFPPIGIPNIIATTSIPAKDRYINGEPLILCDEVIATGMNPSIEKSGNAFKVFPNPFSSSIDIITNDPEKNSLQISLSDMSGRIISQQIMQSCSMGIGCTLPLSSNLTTGYYLLKITTDKESNVFKVLKN